MEQELISPERMYFKNELAISVSKKESFIKKLKKGKKHIFSFRRK